MQLIIFYIFYEVTVHTNLRVWDNKIYTAIHTRHSFIKQKSTTLQEDPNDLSRCSRTVGKLTQCVSLQHHSTSTASLVAALHGCTS